MIYCVEDDESIRELMLYALKASGFDCQGFEAAPPFWEAMEQEKPQLIMLDVMLPGEDGISILRHLREKSATAAIPVIMASAKGTEFDKVTGLDLGADDYLAKPFGMMEMISRVKAVLRRSRHIEDSKALQVLTSGHVEINVSQHRVMAAGREIEVSLKEFKLLRLFMENPGMVFTRDKLLDAIWDTDYLGETRTVDMHISSLRTKLGAAGKCIKTVRGMGYRWEASHE